MEWHRHDHIDRDLLFHPPIRHQPSQGIRQGALSSILESMYGNPHRTLE
jgi:hypothetical protein